MLVTSNKYQRINNVIYENGIPIIKLLQNFRVDILNMDAMHIHYMNRYLAQSEDLYQLIKLEDMPNNIVKMFYDLETTGTERRKHGVHQIAGLIEVNGVVVERFNFKTKPNPKALIDPGALKHSGVTEEQILTYPDMAIVHKQFTTMLGKYCDRYNAREKIWLCAFNGRGFDDKFLRSWFEQNGDSFFGSWFWSDSLDVLVLASQYLINRRKFMPSFKLKRVAKELGISVDESRLHDAEYDTDLLYQVYMIVVGLEIE